MLNGVINIYKEKGYTSHDVVNIVRKKMKRIKTGHTGTLDPNAEGVLPICIGKATKISDYIQAEKKRYTANLILGIRTDTLDIDGNILTEEKASVPLPQLKEILDLFVGEIKQIPPMYSAIKIGGKKLYELARNGIEIERKERDVTIYSIDILESISENNIKLDILCSKGTYIRSLCADIGEKLGVGAVMGDLTRTMSGDFLLSGAITLDEFSDYLDNDELDKILIPIDKALNFKSYSAMSSAQKYLLNGNKVSLNYIAEGNLISEDEKILIYDCNNDLIGIYIKEDDFIKPVTMLYSIN